MRRRQLGLAMILAATATAGAWVVTERPGPAKTIRVEGPSQPLAGAPVGSGDPTASAAPRSLDELLQQGIDSAKGRLFCSAPPVAMTEELRQAIEKALPMLPVPPTIPGDPPGAVSNVQVLLVPC